METDKSFFWGNLFRRRDPWRDEVSRLWADTPLFKGIPLREIRSLANNMHRRRYTSGEYLFHAGDKGAGAAVILSGNVCISNSGVALATLGPGDFFGEISLVLDVPRTADAEAMVDSEVIFFLRPEMDEWLSRAPLYAAKLSKNLALVLAHRLQRANESLVAAGSDNEQ